MQLALGRHNDRLSTCAPATAKPAHTQVRPHSDQPCSGLNDDDRLRASELVAEAHSFADS